jgi:hypothetical protein
VRQAGGALSSAIGGNAGTAFIDGAPGLPWPR